MYFFANQTKQISVTYCQHIFGWLDGKKTPVWDTWEQIVITCKTDKRLLTCISSNTTTGSLMFFSRRSHHLRVLVFCFRTAGWCAWVGTVTRNINRLLDSHLKKHLLQWLNHSNIYAGMTERDRDDSDWDRDDWGRLLTCPVIGLSGGVMRLGSCVIPDISSVIQLFININLLRTFSSDPAAFFFFFFLFYNVLALQIQ